MFARNLGLSHKAEELEKAEAARSGGKPGAPDDKRV
jgi:hypothetical protein